MDFPHTVDLNFFKKYFIYLFDREIASERGNTAGGVGEEEAGSQRRSPMWDSIPDPGTPGSRPEPKADA